MTRSEYSLWRKTTLSRSLGGYGYSIVGAPLAIDEKIIPTRVVWGEHIEGDPREILADAEGDEKAQRR
jgi:hypothetical protein